MTSWNLSFYLTLNFSNIIRNWKKHITPGHSVLYLVAINALFWDLLAHSGSPCTPQGKVTANQYAVVLSDHLYPIMDAFYPDMSGRL